MIFGGAPVWGNPLS